MEENRLPALRYTDKWREQEAEEDNQRSGCEGKTNNTRNEHERSGGQQNRKIWRSLVETSSSANARWRRNWNLETILKKKIDNDSQ